MMQATSDDVRIALLNRTASLRIGPSMYIDDQKLKTDSRGHAAFVCQVAHEASNQSGSILLPSKSVIVLKEARQYGLIPTTAGQIKVGEQHRGLAMIMHENLSRSAQFQDIERRLLFHILKAKAAIVTLGLSFQALVRYATTRSQKSALYTCCVMINATGFTVWINSLQEKAMRRMLGLRRRLPRVILMKELGIDLRWSTQFQMDAVMLYQRLCLNPRNAYALPILEEASKYDATWITAVKNLQTNWEIHTMRSTCDMEASTSGRKYRIKKFKVEAVKPAVLAWEDRQFWHAQIQTVQLHNAPIGLTVTDAAALGVPAVSVQVWAQLRLQGFFSKASDGSNNPGPSKCALCGDPNELETAEHLLSACDATATDVESARTAMSAAGRHLVDGYVWTLFVLGNCPKTDLPYCIGLVDTIYHRTLQAQVVPDDISMASSTDQEDYAPK